MPRGLDNRQVPRGACRQRPAQRRAVHAPLVQSVTVLWHRCEGLEALSGSLSRFLPKYVNPDDTGARPIFRVAVFIIFILLRRLS